MMQRQIYVLLDGGMLVTSHQERVKFTQFAFLKIPNVMIHSLFTSPRPGPASVSVTSPIRIHLEHFHSILGSMPVIWLWIIQKEHPARLCIYDDDNRKRLGGNLKPSKRFIPAGCTSMSFVLFRSHTPVCTHSQTLVLPLPSSVMSLSKDLFPHISLWTFLRSRLLHPWNWRLEWILSPLINFIYHSLCLLLLLTVNLLIWKGSCWTDVLRSSHYSADPWHLILDGRTFLCIFFNQSYYSTAVIDSIHL